ncbi:MAG: hypothetical protein ACI4UO_01010 [Paludibacteraceae bacterium]
MIYLTALCAVRPSDDYQTADAERPRLRAVRQIVNQSGNEVVGHRTAKRSIL